MTPPRRTRRRGRTPLPEAERKDRLVQARVPENLDETLREEAKRNRVSVSQLIRNVLEDTFALVDDVVVNSTSLAKTVRRDALRIAEVARGGRKPAATATTAVVPAEPAPAAALDAVVAWQEVVINRETDCARCGRRLVRGDKGAYGLQDDPAAPKLWLCLGCVASL